MHGHAVDRTGDAVREEHAEEAERREDERRGHGEDAVHDTALMVDEAEEDVVGRQTAFDGAARELGEEVYVGEIHHRDDRERHDDSVRYEGILKLLVDDVATTTKGRPTRLRCGHTDLTRVWELGWGESG